MFALCLPASVASAATLVEARVDAQLVSCVSSGMLGSKRCTWDTLSPLRMNADEMELSKLLVAERVVRLEIARTFHDDFENTWATVGPQRRRLALGDGGGTVAHEVTEDDLSADGSLEVAFESAYASSFLALDSLVLHVHSIALALDAKRLHALSSRLTERAALLRSVVELETSVWELADLANAFGVIARNFHARMTRDEFRALQESRGRLSAFLNGLLAESPRCAEPMSPPGCLAPEVEKALPGLTLALSSMGNADLWKADEERFKSFEEFLSELGFQGNAATPDAAAWVDALVQGVDTDPSRRAAKDEEARRAEFLASQVADLVTRTQGGAP